MRVLIVEDEQRLAANVARSLREGAGYAVDIAGDGDDGLFMARSNPYDLIILDLMLPKLDGLSLLQRLRVSSSVPVLVLTARDEKESIVALLNSGADDYVAKPFDLGELLARAKALVRRGKGPEPASDQSWRPRDQQLRPHRPPQRQADRVDRDGVSRAGIPGASCRRRDPKTELLEHLYDFNWERFSNVIEVYISGLRRKLDDTGDGRLIHTLRGQGYMLRG